MTSWVFFLTKTSGIHAKFPTKFLLHFVYNLILSYMHCRKQPQNTSENKVNLGFAGLQWLLCAEPARLGNIASVKCELKNNRLMDLYLHRKERPYTGSFIWHFRSYLFIYLFTWVAFLIKSGQKKKNLINEIRAVSIAKLLWNCYWSFLDPILGRARRLPLGWMFCLCLVKPTGIHWHDPNEQAEVLFPQPRLWVHFYQHSQSGRSKV